MRICVSVIIICVAACATARHARAECEPEIATQISAVRDSWVTNWNARKLDKVVELYAADATLLASDGTRVSGQNKVRKSFQQQIESKISLRSLSLECSGAIAYESGTYTEELPKGDAVSHGVVVSKGIPIIAAPGKHIEGNYLVVFKCEANKWLIVQHALASKR
jgi:ketosteroid isomerase-like protein